MTHTVAKLTLTCLALVALAAPVKAQVGSLEAQQNEVLLQQQRQIQSLERELRIRQNQQEIERLQQQLSPRPEPVEPPRRNNSFLQGLVETAVRGTVYVNNRRCAWGSGYRGCWR